MSIIYGIMTGIALLLLTGYCFLVRKKEFWLLLLYICVFIINCGYFLISLSRTVEFALFANKVAYLGSVFLSLCMLMTIVKLCGFTYGRMLPASLFSLGVVMFGIICTTGYLPWYYKDVSLVFVEGAAKLEKVYGVLHPVYLIYLVAFFAAMIITIIVSLKQKRTASHKHAAFIAAVVFGNITVWFVEKFIPWDFEFLAVSYLFSELIFLGLYWMMQDYIRVDLVPVPSAEKKTVYFDISTMSMESKLDKVLARLPEGAILHHRERQILEAVLDNKKRRDIADDLHLSENTIKTYTRNLYNKLGVSSRDELYRILYETKN